MGISILVSEFIYPGFIYNGAHGRECHMLDGYTGLYSRSEAISTCLKLKETCKGIGYDPVEAHRKPYTLCKDDYKLGVGAQLIKGIVDFFFNRKQRKILIGIQVD